MTDQEVIQKFFEQYPEYAVQANRSPLLEQAARPLTLQSLAAAAHQLRDTLLFTPEVESAYGAYLLYNDQKRSLAARAAFLEQIRAEREEKEHEALVKQLGAKFQGESLERLREVAEKRRIHGMSASEFRAERAANAATAPKQRQYDGYPQLPEYLVLDGGVQATKIDAAFLLKIIKTDYHIYRRLYNKYGSQQLTDRQNGGA